MVHYRYSIVHEHVVISYNYLYVYIYVIFQTPLKNSRNYFIDTINYIVQSCTIPQLLYKCMK